MLGPMRRGDPNNLVRNKGEGKFLLKQVQPVIPDSGKSAGRLTEKSLPRKIRLQERAGEVYEHIREAGGRMLASRVMPTSVIGGAPGVIVKIEAFE